MSSFQPSIDAINEAKNELERATGVTLVENPDGSFTSVPGEFSCERLELLLDEHIQAVTDMMDAKTAEISAIMSLYAPILSVPSDPLKIIGWAKKVVTGVAGPQIAAAIQLATEIASLASALAGLASAVANAATRLADCIENEIRTAMEDIRDAAMANAISLYEQATAIYENVRDDTLDQLGYNELLALGGDVQAQIDALDAQLANIGDATTQIDQAVTDLDNITIPGSY
jgi:hypothetical protein